MSVEDIIAANRTFADNLQEDASSRISQAIAILQGMEAAELPPGIPPPLPIDPPIPDDPGDVPEYEGQQFTRQGTLPRAPTLAAARNYISPTSPGVAPSTVAYTEPTKPNGEPDTALIEGVPVLSTDFDVPDAPDLEAEIQGIIAPVLTDIEIPDAPTFQAPEFLGVRPSVDLEAPTDLDVTMRQQFERISPIMRDAVNSEIDAYLLRINPEYHNAMASIESRLATYMQGGTALSTEIEDAIYNRTQDKVNADAQRARDKAWGEAARAGFTIPPAILLTQVQDIDQERRNNNVRAATDIAIKQAELEQQNLQFAVTTSANLRQTALNAALSYYSGLVQINGQALEYSRSILDAVVKAFDIAARKAEVEARLYEADANIYEARLKGALAVFEAYTAQVRALEAQANVDQARVSAYRARIEAVQAEANVYRARVDASVARAQLERTKIDLYQAKVQAYGAQTNAYTARWQGYAAAVQGEVAKQQASAEQLKAFQARVQAFEAEVRARSVEVESAARVNESKVRAYSAEVEGFAAANRAESEAVQAEVASFDATIRAYQGKAQAVAERSRAFIARYEAIIKGLHNTAQIYLEHFRSVDQITAQRIGATAQLATASANVYASTAQAALSGLNTLAAQVVNEEA